VNIKLSAGSGDYSVVRSGNGYAVVAADEDNARMASIAQRHADSMARLHYSPDMGEPYAFFTKVAAKFLDARVVGEIPPGRGELEQSGKYAKAKKPA
jgi:hypothetical protein